MAQNRQSEIDMIERDLNRLTRAAMVLGDMGQQNVMLSDNLTVLDEGYRFSANIPQTDFSEKMLSLNENIETSISSLNSKVSGLVGELNTLLAQFKEEQAQWEAEQEELNKK